MKADDPELPSQITSFEILPRLPSKCLMRFKCVCKSWSFLIRNPSFVAAHHNMDSNKHTHLLITAWNPAKEQHFFSIQMDQQGRITPAIHLLTLPTPQIKNERCYNAESINGLVCIYLSCASIHNQTGPENPVRIFNPCTRECIALPPALPETPRAYVTHHFGFNPITNEYKVLQVQKLIPATVRGKHLMFKIFKVGTSSWREIETEVNVNGPSLNHILCSFNKKSVCINGAIHWMHRVQDGIMAFDIGEEKFRLIPLPKDYDHIQIPLDYPFGDIVEVDGCIAVIGDKQLTDQNMMGFWIMKDYENQAWVEEEIVFPSLWWELGYPLPFCNIHTGELLLSTGRSSRQRPAHVAVYPYNMKSESFRGSESIVLPPEWAFLSSSIQLQLLGSYEDCIVPLR